VTPLTVKPTVADPARSSAPKPKRQRNLRGQGARLRDEIIVGAEALLERTGSEAAITMRAVAREVGIAPPSMAPHFADRAEIIDAVVAQELTRLHEALFAAIASESGPVAKALAGARAYVAHGQAHPERDEFRRARPAPRLSRSAQAGAVDHGRLVRAGASRPPMRPKRIRQANSRSAWSPASAPGGASPSAEMYMAAPRRPLPFDTAMVR
jgi:AcrR family transcriptional regulator